MRHGICVAKMLDNVGLRYPHRASGAKAPRTLRPLPLLRFAISATGGAHLCSIQYYLRFWLGICRTSLAVSALRIMRYCHKTIIPQGCNKTKKRCPTLTDWGQGRGTAETYSVMPQKQIGYSPISTRVTSGSFLGASFGKVNSRMPSVNLALTSLGCRSVPT